MSRWKTAWLATAVLMLVGMCAVPASAQIFHGNRSITNVNQPGVKTWSSRDVANGAKYFSVMGHVKEPNTFELPTSSPSLVKFIELAGGLKSTASGQIRIIRGGRVGQQAYYSPKSTITLLPGDLVVVEGKVGQGAIYRGGNSTVTDPNQTTQLGLIGVRPWPVIMEVNAERATVRWITQQLGQSEAAALDASRHAIIPRSFQAVALDTRLSDSSVIVFDEALIDGSRLPAELPLPETIESRREKLQQRLASAAPLSPRNAPGAEYPGAAVSEPAPAIGQPAQSPRPVVQTPQSSAPGSGVPIPIPGSAYGQFGARPGHSAIAQLPERNVAPSPQPVPARPSVDEEYVKNLLTHPDSVALDVPASREPIEVRTRRPQSTHGDGAPQNSTLEEQLQGRRTTGSVDSLTGSSAGSSTFDRSGASSTDAQPEFVAREAEKPFESAPDARIAPPGVDAEAESDSDSELTALPIVSSTRPQTQRAPLTPAPASEPVPERSPEASRPGVTPRGSAVPSPTTIDPSLTRSEVSAVASRQSASLAMEAASGLPTSAVPAPPVVTDAARMALSQTPTSNVGQATKLELLVEHDAGGVPDYSRSKSDSTSKLLAGRSQIVEAMPEELGWPVIIVRVFVGIGLLFGAVMFLTMAKSVPPTSEPTPTPAPTPQEKRRELDRLINNELPIEVEPAVMPHQTQHFGKSVANQNRRIDAAHERGPKKPHFLRRRDEGEKELNAPQQPDDPTTSGAGPDSTVHGGSDQFGRQSSKRNVSRGTGRPATPLRPAARVPATSTPAAGSETSSDSRPHAGSAAASAAVAIPTSVSAPAAARTSAAVLARAAGPVTVSSGIAATASEIAGLNVERPVVAAARRSGQQFRVDASHSAGNASSHERVAPERAGSELDRPERVTLGRDVVERSGREAPGKKSASDSVGNGNGSQQPPRRPVPGPRSMAAFVAHSQPEKGDSKALATSEAAAAMPAEARRSRTLTRNSATAPDISVPPAPSVADGSDLLDRILSSVQREKR